MKKLTALLLVFILIVSVNATVFAEDGESVGEAKDFANGEARTDVSLVVDTSGNMSATVPLQVTLAVAADGTVKGPSNYTITNKSVMPIKVTNVAINTESGFATDTNATGTKIGGITLTDAFWHFVNIRTNRAIHVTFKPKSAIAPSVAADPGADPQPSHAAITVRVDGENGSVSPEGKLVVEAGASQTIYFYPDEGYEVNTVLVNGDEADGSSGSYTVENVQGDTEVIVTFAPVNSSKLPCACTVCGTWRAVFPELGCACPWCWLLPLISVVALAVLLILHRLKKGKTAISEPLEK